MTYKFTQEDIISMMNICSSETVFSVYSANFLLKDLPNQDPHYIKEIENLFFCHSKSADILNVFAEKFHEQFSFPKDYYFLSMLNSKIYGSPISKVVNSLMDYIESKTGKDALIEALTQYLLNKGNVNSSHFTDYYFQYYYKKNIKNISQSERLNLDKIVSAISFPPIYSYHFCRDLLKKECFVFQFTKDSTRIFKLLNRFSDKASFLQQNLKMLEKTGIDINQVQSQEISLLTNVYYKTSFNINREPIIQILKVNASVAQTICDGFLKYIHQEIKSQFLNNYAGTGHLDCNGLHFESRYLHVIENIDEYKSSPVDKFIKLLPHLKNLEVNKDKYCDFIKQHIDKAELFEKLTQTVTVNSSSLPKNKI